MKKILTAVIVLALCANSYGTILVYKVSEHLSGFTVGPSQQPNTGKKTRDTLKGFVVINVNTTTLNSVTTDPNNRPAFIAVDPKSFVILSASVPDVQQAAFNLTTAGDKYMQKFLILKNNGKATKKVIILPDFIFRFDRSSPVLVVQFSNSLVDGKLVSVDIGTATKALVPRSIKGDAFYFITTDVGGAQETVGRVSFKLDSSLTKLANDRAIPFTVNQTVEQIAEKLTKSGHMEMTPVEFYGQ
jgi:hypothetical protein